MFIKLFLILFSFLDRVMAQCPEGSICIENPLGVNTFWELIDRIINYLFNISIYLLPVMIVIGAYYYLTALGDQNRLGTGKRIIFWSIIGFAIIVISKGLIEILQDILEIT